MTFKELIVAARKAGIQDDDEVLVFVRIDRKPPQRLRELAPGHLVSLDPDRAVCRNGDAIQLTTEKI